MVYRLAAWLTVPLLVAVLAGPALAVRISTADVKQISGDQEVVGTSVLARHDDTLTLTVETTELPSGTYTVWWVIFNKPKKCSDGECGMDDLSIAEAEVSLLWGTGGVAGSDGRGEFRAFLTAGEPAGEVVFGPGLTHPQRAEVHVVLRHHGPVSNDVDVLKAQLTTLGGGCSPCANVQMTLHK